MKRLPITFTLGPAGDRFDYAQIERNERAAIYSQSQDGEVVAFEVIRVKRHDGYSIGGHYIRAGESYPGSKSWGKSGWTFGSLEEARQKFAALSGDTGPPPDEDDEAEEAA